MRGTERERDRHVTYTLNKHNFAIYPIIINDVVYFIIFHVQDPNQLIYAELDIKSPTEPKTIAGVKKSVNEKPSNIDKTEYAEILYVSPTSGQGNAGGENKESKSKENEVK